MDVKKVVFFEPQPICNICPLSESYREMNGLWTAMCRKPGGIAECPMRGIAVETLRMGTDRKLHRESE